MVGLFATTARGNTGKEETDCDEEREPGAPGQAEAVRADLGGDAVGEEGVAHLDKGGAVISSGERR